MLNIINENDGLLEINIIHSKMNIYTNNDMQNIRIIIIVFLMNI